jgi:hypothetical protein
MVLLVVFVPAFSMIFSPATLPPHECPECPTCPECPECPHIECPITECPRIVATIGKTGFCFPEWDIDMIICEFVLTLVKMEGYKYAIVVPFPRDRVIFMEIIDWDTLDVWDYGAEYLNETHSYFEIAETVGYNMWYYVWGANWHDVYAGRGITIHVIREDVDVRDVLG